MSELQSAASLTGGIQVTLEGLQGDWVVSGWLEDQATGYSANIPFGSTPPEVTAQKASPSYAELGLMVGASPMLAFPAGTSFTPYSVLRNISNQVISVTPSVWWMEGAFPRSARLAPITVPPYSAQNLNVPSLLSRVGLQHFNGSVNLVLDASGPRAALLLAAGSVDQKNTYVFQVTPSVVSESVGKSLSYWSTGNGDDTMVTLWNPADESQDVLFTLVFSGGRYAYPVHLEARATRAFDLSEIIRSQIPDAEGNTIPLSVQEGSAELSGSRSEAEHILVAVDAGTYNVQKAMCGNYCANCHGSTDSSISADPSSVAVGFNAPLAFISYRDNGSQWDLTYASSWYSSDTNVITVDTGSITGASEGSAYITATDPDEPNYNHTCGYNYPPDCANFAGVSQTVQKSAACATPYNFHQTSGTGSGGTLTFNYEWSSTDGQMSHLAGCKVGEYVAYPGPPGLYFPPVPPFPSDLSFSNPTTGSAVENSGDIGAGMDTHSTPGTFVTPFPIGTTQFVATQYYYYKCPCKNSGLPAQIYPTSGTINITRKVDASDTTSGTFTITKSGVSSSKAVP